MKTDKARATLNIGDKVRFLNNVGGGVVTAFQGKNLVLVEDENGFEIPSLVSECILVGDPDDAGNVRKPQPVPPASSAKDAQKAGFGNPSLGDVVKKTPVTAFREPFRNDRLNVSLAFLPVNPRDFMQTSFDAYLINESNYYLYFIYMSCYNKSWTTRAHGLIEPDTKIFVEPIDKKDVNEIEHIGIQLIAYKENRPFLWKEAASIDMRLDTVKFHKLHCFVENDFFDENALIFPLIVDDAPERQMLISAADIREAMTTKKDAPRVAPATATSKKSAAVGAIIEVDLHINQLLDSTSGMGNADIFNYQMAKFHETMKANVGKKGQKIVFIHGKGDGVLRTALEKELKTSYKQQCTFQDASFREYGFGATMVIIH